MTRRRRQRALAGGGRGGGTRTNGQAEVLVFPQASLPDCIRPRISGGMLQMRVILSRAQVRYRSRFRVPRDQTV